MFEKHFVIIICILSLVGICYADSSCPTDQQVIDVANNYTVISVADETTFTEVLGSVVVDSAVYTNKDERAKSMFIIFNGDSETYNIYKEVVTVINKKHNLNIVIVRGEGVN